MDRADTVELPVVTGRDPDPGPSDEAAGRPDGRFARWRSRNAGAADRPREPTSGAFVRRMRLAAGCAALTALAVVQSPGVMVADTKVDLAVNPLQFLARSLSLWDPTASFGQANDQTVGYLWPMGPFFVVAHALDVPGWLAQRLWWGLLMSVAFTGVVTLARKMNIGTPGARMIAGFAFALCPRILSEIGANSVEAWPTAVAPWVLVPLIALAEGARLRRPIALSALAVACAGGVNATAVLAVVPLPLIWLATLHPLRRRIAALIVWFGAMLLATAWWLVPLAVLGKYSPPFLNYTETAETTTRLTDATSVLRGASHWVAYLATNNGPTWPAGFRLSTEPFLIVFTLIVTGLGVLGLSRHGIARRGFLVSSLIVGVALVSLGHVSDMPFTFAGVQRAFLDGLGAPLRNVHKFDLVLRLPLVLGMAHALGTVSRLGAIVRGVARPARAVATLFIAGAMAAVIAVATPALAFQLAPPDGYTDVPQYWRDAAAWLNKNTPPDRVLIIPGATFPDYTWGATGDEVAEPLLSADWGVRNIIPLAPPGTIRLLDAIEDSLESGSGSPGLADLLARSGVRYLLVRSDLDYGRTGAIRPIAVHQALARSPGLELTQSFGPLVGGDRPFGVFVDAGLDVAVHSLEVYQVDRTVTPVAVYDSSDVTTVVGGPESLLSMAADGNLSQAPSILAGDLGNRAPPGPVTITDGLRRHDVAFGSLHDNTSETMTTDEPFPVAAPAHDYLPSWGPSQLTVAQYQGVSDFRTSSSDSDAATLGGSRPEHQPYAVLDGDLSTSWRPAPDQPPDGQWIELDLAAPQPVTTVHMVFDSSAAAHPVQVTVNTDTESAVGTTFGATLDVGLPGVQSTSKVRITVNQVVTTPGMTGTFGIAEVGIPSLVSSRTLVSPAPPATTSGAATVVLTAAPSVPACYFVGDVPACNPDAARGSEDGTTLDRTVTLPAEADYTPQVWGRPRPGQALDSLLDNEVAKQNPLGIVPGVTASSTSVLEPVGRPGAIIDGDPNTIWSPAATDTSPLLRLTFLAARTVSGIQLIDPPDAAITRPGIVQVIGDDGVRGGIVDNNGIVTFDPPLRTKQLTIVFTPPSAMQSVNPYTGVLTKLPIGVGEIIVRPALANPALDLDRTVELPCGSGPTLAAGGRVIQTRLSGTRRDLQELREMAALPCGASAAGAIDLTSGEQRIVAAASAFAVPTRLSLAPADSAHQAVATPVRVDTWGPTVRSVHVNPGPGQRIVAVRENINPGWHATLGGKALDPVTLDGWQQGFVVPAGLGGEIELRFTPDGTYRTGLLIGGALLLALILLAVWPGKHGAHARGPAWAPARRTDRLAALAIGAAGLILVGGLGGILVAVAGVIAAFYRSLFPRPGTANSRSVLRAVELWVPVTLLAVGGYLALTGGYNEHTTLGPQLAGLACVAALWLSVVSQPSARSGRQVHQRPLEQVVAQRGEDQRARQRDDVGRQRIAGQVGPVLNPEQLLQHKKVPQEDPVRDRPEPM